MLSHVISIPFIGLQSTHTAHQLKPPQSLLLPSRRNTSFPANSYPLKLRKFHNLKDLFSLYALFSNEGLSSQGIFKETVFCSIITWGLLKISSLQLSLKFRFLGSAWTCPCHVTCDPTSYAGYHSSGGTVRGPFSTQFFVVARPFTESKTNVFLCIPTV